MTLHPWVLQAVFPKNKNILLQNHIAVMKCRKFSIAPMLISGFQSSHILPVVPITSFIAIVSPVQSPISRRCHVSLFPFNLEQCLGLSLSFVSLTFLKGQVHYFVACLSMCVCLMLHCDPIQTMPSGYTMAVHPVLVMPTLITWVRWDPLIFPLIKFPFHLWVNKLQRSDTWRLCSILFPNKLHPEVLACTHDSCLN